MRPRDENKLQAVTRKAVEMISKKGLDGFSINTLAKEAGVSPATIYIYYKDKEDLITSIGIDEGKRMSKTTLKGFDPNMSFSEGLWVQWKNRSRYMLNNPVGASFLEQMRNSPFGDKMTETISKEFKVVMGAFMVNAIQKGEIDKMPIEVYWAVAFAPLYTLVRFHNEGRSIGGKKFVFSEKIMRQTFEVVLKGLKK